MPSLKGTKTEQNLQTAFAGESQAHTKYEFYANQAKKDGYEQISAIFEETSKNEKEHAKLWYKALHDDKIGDTPTNLKLAAEGENYEHKEMYADFAREAREEGFEDLAKLFEGVGDIEKTHDTRFQKLLKNIEQGNAFKADGTTIWKCRNCGYIHTSSSAPEKCPVCAHPQSFFEIEAQNY